MVLTRFVVGSLHLAALDLLPKSRCSLVLRSAGRLTLTQQQQQQQANGPDKIGARTRNQETQDQDRDRAQDEPISARRSQINTVPDGDNTVWGRLRQGVREGASSVMTKRNESSREGVV